MAVDAHVERARHDQPGRRRSSSSRTRAACRCWSTARRRRITCRSTCRRSTAISTSPPATSCTARPASACCTASEALLEAMPPFMGGGDMIRSVTFEKSTWNDAAVQVRGRHAGHRRRGRPRRGASTTSQAIGLRRRSPRTSATCSTYGTAALRAIAGRAADRHRAATRRASCRSCMDGVHPHDIGTIVDREGVAIRTGHHCAQPVMERFGIPATARASLAMYNTARRHRRAGRRARAACARCSVADVRPERPLSGSHPRPQPAAAELPDGSTAPAITPKATTRCAAIALHLYLRVDDDADHRRRRSRARAARSRRRRRR